VFVEKTCKNCFDDLKIEFILAVEDVIDHRFVDRGFSRNLFHPGAVPSFFREYDNGSGKNSFSARHFIPALQN
jgi:hypothetical protein